MNYNKIVPAKFIERENRFVARVSLTNENEESAHKPAPGGSDASIETSPVTEVPVHVKNTGRCRELLVPGATVYLADHADRMGTRKYRYDLIAVEKETPDGTILINMDSQAPNKVVNEALESESLDLFQDNNMLIRPETTFGSSRFDFYLETEPSTTNHKQVDRSKSSSTPTEARRAFIEVKGVTLEKDGIARFPDAPTERGVKHIKELERAMSEGYEAYIIFVIQMKGIDRFEPNDVTHPQFGEALRHAEKSGVRILAFDCIVRPDRLTLDQPIQVRL